MTLRILHLIDTTGPGGAEDVFISLAGELQSSAEVNLAVLKGKGYVHDQLLKRNVKTEIVPAGGSFNIKLVWQLLRLVRKHKITIIQSHLLGSNVYAAIVGLLTGVPVVATYHGMVDIAPNERFKRLKLWFMRKGISRFVVVSDSLFDKVFASGLLVEERTCTIYNGIRLDNYTQQRDNELRKRLALSDDTVILGALGNLRPAKRYDIMVEAFGKLQATGADVALVIGGDPRPSIKSKLDALIAEKGIRDCHFLGFVDNTPSYLSNLDGFLLSSESEGFSISTIEAMASGLPVLATRCGGPEEIISDTEQGSLVDCNVEAFAAGLTDLVANIKAGHTINNAGRIRVAEHFSEQAMLKRYLHTYMQLMNVKDEA